MKKSPGSGWKPSAWASGVEGSTAPTATTPITSAPALQTEFLDTIAAIERPLAEAIAARTDSNRDTGLGPEVLAMSSELLVQTRQPPPSCVRPIAAAPGRWPVEGVR
jgi:hypothetical protein